MSGSAALRTFGVCLWKEWRDHRAVLLGMVLIVPLLLAVLALALPRKMFDYPGFADNTAVACLAILVISLTTDLVPGEARRGHRGFLERLPGGLRAPFLAKLVLFAGSAAVFTAFGYAAGADTCYVVAGAVPYPFSPGATTWVLAVAALWTFAVSCSLPRGALSLPATGALALVVGLPILVCREIEPTTDVPSLFTSWSVALWAAGAVGAAWLAIRRTVLLRAGGACLAVGAVCAVPFWADAVHYVVCPEPRISEGWLGEGGRYAFLECARRVPPRSGPVRVRPLPFVIVDLRDGTSCELSRDGEYGPHGLSREGFPQRFISLGQRMFDARTAQPASPRQDEIREALRAAAPSRLPDGRRLWVFGGRLEADGADGEVEVLESRWPYDVFHGVGFEVQGRRIYDATRRRYYERNALGLRLHQSLHVRAGRWLVKKTGSPYELLDPDTGEFAPAAGFEPNDSVCAMLDDGRMVVKRDGAFLVLDPETGETVPQPNLSGGWIGNYRSGRTPDGRRVFLRSQRSRHALARFDPATDTFATTAWVECDCYSFLLACPTDDTAIVHDGSAIYRLRFGGDEKEEIWRVR